MKKKQIEKVDYKDRCGDMSLDVPNKDGSSSVAENVLTEREYDVNSEHPTPEQLLIREATKHLTPKQKKVWGYHNYDRMTQDEIALKMGISQQVVGRHIKACEKRIAKWVKNNLGAYKLLKGDLK